MSGNLSVDRMYDTQQKFLESNLKIIAMLSAVSKVVTMVSVVGRYETYGKILRPKDLKPYRPARDTSTSESPEIKKISLTFKFCHNFARSLFCYIFYQII